MKHILITGGAGFIGSHLCDELLERGFAVTAVDNLISGRKENIAQSLTQAHFSYVERDVCEPFKRSDFPFLEKYGLHGVLHFASPASPVDFQRIPFEILKVGSVATMHLTELAQTFNARFVFASTSEVYGDPLVHPQKEDYWGNVHTLGPRAAYDESKRFGEAWVSSAVRKGLNGGMVRIFNTYGPRMRLNDGRVVPQFCDQALKGEDLTVHGDGSQTRSFCYVDDLVDGILKYFESDLKDPVNLGNPIERTILDFAQFIIEKTQSKSKICFLPLPEDDPKQRCPDITRAKELLGWEPKVSLEEGIQRFSESLK
jgi:dTDP-glucose 4,6-dehydratase